MSVNFSHYSLARYLDQISVKEPIPGGGSASAYTAALGVALLAMVGNYSIGRKNNSMATDARLAKSLKSLDVIRKRLLVLTTLDSRAYLEIVAARKKDKKIQDKASRAAAKIGKEICQLCFKALNIAPFLVERGNPYLVSDVHVAVELLEAGFKGSMVMIKVNQ